MVVAGIGLAATVAWLAHSWAVDLPVVKMGVAFSSVGSSVPWIVRLGTPLCATVLAGVALLNVVRGRSARLWYAAVVVVALGPLIARGFPLRFAIVPEYLVSAFYIAAALSEKSRGVKRQSAA
jgi:hypothetical protein